MIGEHSCVSANWCQLWFVLDQSDCKSILIDCFKEPDFDFINFLYPKSV